MKPAQTAPLVRLSTLAAVGSALGWLWMLTCVFPTEGFNFLRLRPSFLLASGTSLYETAQTAPITTWIYGPVLPVLLWPATLAPDSASALLIASFLNTGLLLLGLGWYCLRWEGALPLGPRVLVLALTVLVVPRSMFQYLQADNAAGAFALVAMASLLAAKEDRKFPLWLAAIAGVCAVGSKQLAVANLLAQVIWLLWKDSFRAALAHALRCAVCGIAGLGLALVLWGREALWFKMLLVPARLPFSHFPERVLAANSPYLFGYALLLLLAWRGAARHRGLALAALTGTCALPLGLAALLRGGGAINSLHGLLLLTPAVLFGLHEELQQRALNARAGIVVAVLVTGLLVARGPEARELPLTPRLELARGAEILARQHRGQIWFPWNPLATYYVDRRHDHDEDGLYVRQETALFPTRRLVQSGLPPDWRVTAFNRHLSWDVAAAMLPEKKQRVYEADGWLVVEHAPSP